jgi:hypothetical protein
MSDLVAVLQAIVKSTADMQGAILKAMLESRAPQYGASPLDLLRELRPMFDSGGASANALLQGVEIAKGLFQSAQGQATPVPADDLGAALSSVLKMVAPHAAQPAASPAAPPAAQPVPPWMGWAPPPGWGVPPWMAGPFGWPTVPPAATARAPDLETTLLSALSNPAVRDRLRAFLATADGQPAAGAGPAASSASAAGAAGSSPAATVDAPAAPVAADESFNLGAMLADPEIRQIVGGIVPPEAIAALPLPGNKVH